MNWQKLSQYSPVVLRLGLAAVIIWFGRSQMVNPDAWVTMVPNWAISLSHLSALTIVTLNMWLEIILGLLLAVGVQVRLIAAILTLHLFVISADLGFSAIGVRDFGLTFAMLSITLNGPDLYCFEYKEKENI